MKHVRHVNAFFTTHHEIIAFPNIHSNGWRTMHTHRSGLQTKAQTTIILDFNLWPQHDHLQACIYSVFFLRRQDCRIHLIGAIYCSLAYGLI